MEQQTLNRLFIGQYIVMFIILVAVAVIGVYKWSQAPVPAATPTKVEPEKVALSKGQLNCLAQNVYHEARGESPKGQEAVAWVTLNRVASKQFPDDICKVVNQKGQFSWTALASVREKISEVRAWNAARKVAQKVVDDYMADASDPTKGATFYHADSVSPSWADSMKQTAVIGDHIFYKQVKPVTVASR